MCGHARRAGVRGAATGADRKRSRRRIHTARGASDEADETDAADLSYPQPHGSVRRRRLATWTAARGVEPARATSPEIDLHAERRVLHGEQVRECATGVPAEVQRHARAAHREPVHGEL